MNILDQIIAEKRMEVAVRKAGRSREMLENSRFFARPRISLKNSLLDISKTGIIAEFKRRSPSKGTIHEHADVSAITTAYTKFGASGLSVLTDEKFFGGSISDLENARVNEIPVLRKDFIVDAYQVLEARSMGADVILLIASCLSPEEVQTLAFFAKELELEVLLEIHGEDELDRICDEVDLVGVNNRDLKTFTVDVNRSVELSKLIPPDKITVAESGIDSVETINHLKKYGFKGFLIGEHFMKQPDPAIAFASFVNQLNKPFS